MSDNVNEITSKGEFESIRDRCNILFIDCYADWCMPCKVVAPAYEQLAKAHVDKEGVEFCKFNVEDDPQLAGSFKFLALPTFYAYRDGECVDKCITANPTQLMAFVQRHISSCGCSGPDPGIVAGTDRGVGTSHTQIDHLIV